MCFLKVDQKNVSKALNQSATTHAAGCRQIFPFVAVARRVFDRAAPTGNFIYKGVLCTVKCRLRSLGGLLWPSGYALSNLMLANALVLTSRDGAYRGFAIQAQER